MTRVKTFNNVKGVLQQSTDKDIDTFIDKGFQIIQGFTKIHTLLVEEEEYKGELIPGLDYEDFQLNELEEVIMNVVDPYSVEQVRRIINYGFVGEGKNSERLVEGVNRLESTLKEIDLAVTDFVFFDSEELKRLRSVISVSLSDFIFGYANTLSIFLTEYTSDTEEVEVQTNLYRYLTKNAVDIGQFARTIVGLLEVFPPEMGVMEEYPEEWEEFLKDISYDYIVEIWDYAEYITIEDIVKYREGKIDVDEDFINMLEARRRKDV